MTLKDLIATDVDDVFLNLDDFAEQVIRYAGGDRAKASVFTAIVTWHPTDKDDARGIGYRRRAEMFVNDQTQIAAADAVSVGGVRCEVESITHVDDGGRVVNLIQYQPEAKGVRKAGDI